MFAVAGIVLVISVGWRFSGYLEQAAAGAMTKEVLFALMAYRLPGFLELIVPISFFLAIMLTYGRLHVDSEMVVLHSCGMSPARIVFITLVLSALVMLITAFISLWLKPMGERQVEALLAGQKTLTEFDTLIPGRFQILSSGKRVTYTEEVTEAGDLSDIFINEFQDIHDNNVPRDVVTVIAESGKTQVDDSGRRFLVLKDGSRYRGLPGDKNYQIVRYEEYGQLVESNPHKGDPRRTAIPTLELLEAEDAEAISELHWRIGVVLMIPVIAVMAVPLSKVNPRQGRFTRLIPGVILCFVYVISLSGARSGLEKGNLPLEYGLWWIHGIFVVIMIFVFYVDRIADRLSNISIPGPASR